MSMAAAAAAAAAAAINNAKDDRAIFFFDIDNCLYPKSKRVHDHMARLINQYFTTHLSISPEQGLQLQERYYKEYGLAIEGLARYHQVDPMDFNRQVDDALPLDGLLTPDPELRKILESFDKTKVKMWLFTNAHVTHAKRVLKLLEVEDLFEGLTYCDYSQNPLVPKPVAGMFDKAEREAGVSDRSKVYYVDDTLINCQSACARGWVNTVHLLEPEPQSADNKLLKEEEDHNDNKNHKNNKTKACPYQISSLQELLDLFPELLVKKT